MAAVDRRPLCGLLAWVLCHRRPLSSPCSFRGASVAAFDAGAGREQTGTAATIPLKHGSWLRDDPARLGRAGRTFRQPSFRHLHLPPGDAVDMRGAADHRHQRSLQQRRR